MGNLKGLQMSRSWTATELMEMVRAFQPACIITAAADLNFFTLLAGGPMTAIQLAARSDSAPRATAVLLDALAALALLKKDRDVYSIPPDVAALLSERAPTNVLATVRHQGNCLRRWVQLAGVVQKGRPAEPTTSIRGPAADCETFIAAMDSLAAAVAAEIGDKLRMLRFHHLLDIGGASGTWTIAFLQAAPQATATLFDLPEVIPLAKGRLADANLLERVTLVAGDYNVDDLPPGADLAWLSAVAHQNSREQNRTLYSKIYRALAPGGVLVIRDIVMERSHVSPVAGALFAINMLVGTAGGCTYTLDEFRDDLTLAGFVDIELIHKDTGMRSLIIARRGM
jgi:predicted O-methyltransferase YrrM